MSILKGSKTIHYSIPQSFNIAKQHDEIFVESLLVLDQLMLALLLKGCKTIH